MKAKYDWLKFWVHFTFGTFLGLVVSFAVFGSWFDLFSAQRWILTAGTTLIVGILGGFFGDLLWTRLLGSRFFRLLSHWSWP
jgi:hypothetical protein